MNFWRSFQYVRHNANKPIADCITECGKFVFFKMSSGMRDYNIHCQRLPKWILWLATKTAKRY